MESQGREVHEEFWEGIHDLFQEVVDVDTEATIDLSKPDIFHVLECRNRCYHGLGDSNVISLPVIGCGNVNLWA